MQQAVLRWEDVHSFEQKKFLIEPFLLVTAGVCQLPVTSEIKSDKQSQTFATGVREKQETEF